jgi:hypothetical protein
MIQRIRKLVEHVRLLAATSLELAWVLGTAAVDACKGPIGPATETTKSSDFPIDGDARPIEDPTAYGERLARFTKESFSPRNVVRPYAHAYVPGDPHDPNRHRKDTDA